MNQLRNLLIGYDFSAGAAAALNQGVRLASWNNAKLIVQHVVAAELADDLATALDRDVTGITEEARRSAQTELDQILTETGITAQTVVTAGWHLDEMLQAIPRHQIDLLVLGVRGEETAGPGAGMLATKLVRKAATKVLLVQPGHSGPYRNILVGVDFSENSTEAIHQARHIAARDGATVHCVHVYEPPWHRLRYRASVSGLGPEFQRRFEAVMLQRLGEIAAAAGADANLCSLAPATHHAQGLIARARSLAADLIVIGTHGRSALRYLLLGSTAESLVRETECSVLTIRARTAPNVLASEGAAS